MQIVVCVFLWRSRSKVEKGLRAINKDCKNTFYQHSIKFYTRLFSSMSDERHTSCRDISCEKYIVIYVSPMEGKLG